MALASTLMADIANFIGKSKEAYRFEETASFLSDNKVKKYSTT